jgi:hypothetical protein
MLPLTTAYRLGRRVYKHTPTTICACRVLFNTTNIIIISYQTVFHKYKFKIVNDQEGVPALVITL